MLINCALFLSSHGIKLCSRLEDLLLFQGLQVRRPCRRLFLAVVLVGRYIPPEACYISTDKRAKLCAEAKFHLMLYMFIIKSTNSRATFIDITI